MPILYNIAVKAGVLERLHVDPSTWVDSWLGQVKIVLLYDNYDRKTTPQKYNHTHITIIAILFLI